MRPHRALSLVGAVAAVACLVAGCGTPVTGSTKAEPAMSFCAIPEPTPALYIGVFVRGFPPSTAAITKFEDTTGVRPSLITYYPTFGQSFDAVSACAAVRQGATPVLQIDPKNISLASIATGRYDSYLRSYATAVKAFDDQVVLSFGHEMNGNWYSWGYHHTSSAVFVAAWRHIVTVFRVVGAYNVTWLWTVNVMDSTRGDTNIPSPVSWWPGSSYVTWVGIDGYYYKPSWQFVSLFGPTIAAIRELTSDPILIAETGAAPAAIQPAKIADLFAGIRSYGLLGLVWFDAVGSRDWRLSSPVASAAFRQCAKTDQNC
jgi:mannan endo-1,4-beta-mannosidase